MNYEIILLALFLVNFFYLCFWVSREIKRFIAGSIDSENLTNEEEMYLDIINAPDEDFLRPWALKVDDIPVKGGIVKLRNHQKKDITDILIDASRPSINNVKIVPERDTFAFPIPEIVKLEYDPTKLIKDELGNYFYDGMALIEILSSHCVKGKEYFVRDHDNFVWCVANIVDNNGVHFMPKDRFKLSLFVHHEDMIDVYGFLLS